MEASALARATGRGRLARRSPLLRFESDVRLVGLIRVGHDGAFEVLFNRYHSRLLAFCQSMLKSRQDAEDVLQEVFANAHAAMLRDERPITVRPWLYRIARNRCLNHLRRPIPEGQDSMDIHPHSNGTTTADQVQDREELRQVLDDVRTLPETQRTALLLREIDQLSYDEIAQAMQTTIPAVKSLLVRARIALAESSKARLLTCDEVQVELAEASEGLLKVTGPGRKHVRSCEGCKEFRSQLRSDRKALAALFPLGPFAFIKGGLLSKLFGGTAAGGSAGAGAGSAAVGSASAVGGASGFSGGIGILGGALGAKAAAGMATAALLTAGAVEVRNIANPAPADPSSQAAPVAASPPASQSSQSRSNVPHFVAAPSAPGPASSAPGGGGSAPSAPARSNDAPSPSRSDKPKPAEENVVPEDPALTPTAEATTSDDGLDIGTTVPADDGRGEQQTGSTPAEPPVTSTPAPTGTAPAQTTPSSTTTTPTTVVAAPTSPAGTTTTTTPAPAAPSSDPSLVPAGSTTTTPSG